MRHLIDEWVARAKAKKAGADAIEILEKTPEEPSKFYSISSPMGWDMESMEMGEITGAFRLIEKEMEKIKQGK